jgi:hypothetical protein
MHPAAPKRRRWQPPFGLDVVQSGGRNRTMAFQGSFWLLKLAAELRGPWLWHSIMQSITTHGTRRGKSTPWRISPSILLGIITLSAMIGPSEAAMVNFQNCLSPNIVSAPGPQIPLQWVPLAVSAVFNLSAPSHNLNVTVYGNVTGQATTQPLPPSDSLQWTNPNETLGKIVDVDPDNHRHSTLKAAFNVLTYTPYRALPSSFCNSTLNAVCPIPPVFPNGTGYL